MPSPIQSTMVATEKETAMNDNKEAAEKTVADFCSDASNNRLLKQARSAYVEALFEYANQGLEVEIEAWRSDHSALDAKLQAFCKERGLSADDYHYVVDRIVRNFYGDAHNAALSSL